ncbi:hypothetical protein F5B17DRAFT_390872 [Nemania serpens]|nr:hypothetical protein F5B17DRAFT_390872 [Nemania serpens]
MGSASTTKSVAKFILKSPTISPKTPSTLQIICDATVPKLRAALATREWHRGDVVDIHGVDPVQHVTLLAMGGYNSVWLVKLHRRVETTSIPINGNASEHGPTSSSLPLTVDEFVIRFPCEDALVPHQVKNEVASRLPRIPVPRVFLFEATDYYNTSFIAEEFIHGTSLSLAWISFNPIQKWILARKLAKITVDLADVEFSMIGGLDPTTFSSAPTVEGAKIFKGRHKLHKPECYPIGPYHSTKEYILACYDREIYYYSHAPAANIDASLFETTSVHSFIDQLREKRQALAAENMVDEPFVLVHGDFHGRNILVRGCRIVAVLDWEFAGSYPLSEVLSGGGVDVVELDSEELDEENTVWGRKIRRYIQQEVRSRAWSRKIRQYICRGVKSRAWSRDEIDLLLGDGNRELSKARMEMFP